MTPPGLRAIVIAGARAVSRYTGVVLALFVVHALVAWGAGLVVMRILADAFADKPLFDEGVDGDLVALLEIVRDSSAVVGAIGAVAIGAVMTWIVVSWFLAGGLLAVLVERPRGRAETARCFGAGGAAHFLVFARLGLVSLLYHVPVLFLLGLGLGHLEARLEHALTVRELIAPLLVGLLPAALAHVLVSTVIDHARAELVLRRPVLPGLGAIQAAVRASGFVLRRPLTWCHVLLYWLVFVAISLGFAWLAHGHAMLGLSGALALFVLRQGVVLARLAARVAVVAGQVELAMTRPPPPRPVAPPPATP